MLPCLSKTHLTCEKKTTRAAQVWYGMVWCMAWYGMAEVYEGAPVAVSGWFLTDRHDLAPGAANSLHRGAWYGMVDACDGYLAAEASGSSFG